MICPNCSSTNTVKQGTVTRTKLGAKYQAYFCKDCGKHWSPIENPMPLPNANMSAPTSEVVGNIPDPSPLSIIELQSPRIESLTSCVEPVKENNPPNNT